MSNYLVTPFGLKITPNFTEDDYAYAAQVAMTMKNSACWLLGDLMSIGSDRFDDTYTQYFDECQVSPATLRNYQTVAKSFPAKRRKYNLSFSHYRAVTSLRDDTGKPMELIQDELLREAETRQLNRNELRDLVKQAKGHSRQRETIEGRVGILDTLLMDDIGLAFGTVVRVSYEIVVPNEDEEKAIA